MKTKLTALLAVSMSLLVLSGCGAVNRSAVQNSFEEGQREVYLGMQKWEFDRAMAKNVAKTKKRHRRSPEAYQRNDITYEVVYIRSAFVRDDATTDDSKGVSGERVSPLAAVFLVAPLRGLDVDKLMRGLLESHSALVSGSVWFQSGSRVAAISNGIPNLSRFVTGI